MSPTLLEDGQKGWKCLSCEKTSKQRVHMRDHVEGHHVSLEYNCHYEHCGKVCGSKASLRMHIRAHKRFDTHYAS